MNQEKTLDPYKFLKELKERVKEELKQKEENRSLNEEEVEMAVCVSPYYSLKLIWKIESSSRSNRRTVELRRYLETMVKQERKIEPAKTMEIERLFLFRMNQKVKQRKPTDREVRFSCYDAEIRTSLIRHSAPSTSKRNQK